MTLATLKKKRGCIKSALTSFNKYVESTITKEQLSELDIITLKDRLDNALDLLSEFNNLHNEIEIICEPQALDEQLIERDNFEEKFYSATSNAKLILKKYDDSASTISKTSSNQSVKCDSRGIKLPDISLPKFKGDFEEWLEFRDIFESLIHQNTLLSDIEKFFYLRGALEGSAAASIKKIQYTADNYTVAWDTLRERYNNTKKLLHDHLGCLLFFDTIQKASCDKLQHLADNISRHLGAIQQLGQDINNWDCLLIFWISQKIDNATLCDWERQMRNKSESPTIDEFLEFLRERANFVDSLDYKCNQMRDKPLSKINKEPIRGTKRETTRSLVVSGQYVCSYCKGEHSIYSCEGFLALSAVERKDFVKNSSSICANCLRIGHSISKCKLGPCRKCKLRHNTLLHFERQDTTAESDKSEVGVSVLSSGVVVPSIETVLLSTACVLVHDRHNNSHLIRAILDSGSQTSFITESVRRRLNLPSSNTNLSVFGISNNISKVREKCEVSINSQYSSFSAKLTCYILPEITSNMPNSKICTSFLKIPPHVKLADPNFYDPGPIEMLIGADLFWHLLCCNKINLGKNLPCLQETELGWIVSGQIGDFQPKKSSCNLSINQELLEVLTKFWHVEELSDNKALSQEELECERIFSETTTRQSDGRFVVSMPLKQSPDNLGESRTQAEKRFSALERKLSKNSDLRTRYKDFMSEYEGLNHMTLVSNSTIADCQYYMPHHGVLKESSLTTKLRVVFDASAPTSNGLSLNNIQIVGPVLQDDLLSIILRFRQYTYVISADIAKMYRQVSIDPKQRPLQRILWRADPTEPLKTYELNTVTYGQAAASFLSIRCLFQLAQEIEDCNPRIAAIIKHDFYVDDLLTGANSLEEAQQLCREISSVLKSGCFNLRKWCSNKPEVLADLEPCDLAYDILKFSVDDKTHTLGLIWKCHNDQLMFHINENYADQPLTKRTVLSTTAKIFDPLGLVSPCIILPKMLMQRLWEKGVSWDDPLPEHLQDVWLRFRNKLSELNELSISRHAVIENAVEIELHGFADSSERAYGACIYLRSISQSGNVHVNLLCAKSKVAPIKTISLPRLELCAALLLARLVHKVLQSMSLQFKRCTLWSDSTITLAWIRTSPNLLKTFTGNRVSEIQTLTKNCYWRHVPTADNPADVISRGLFPDQILHCDLWWKGPSWLISDPSIWPNENPTINEVPELKAQTLMTQRPSVDLDFPFERYSSFSKMQRVTAYIIRFKHNCLKGDDRLTGNLTITELRHSLQTLVRISQNQSFYSDILSLTKNKSLNNKNKIAGLTPFIDDEGILRVGGRLKYSGYKFDKKHPILLHGNHYFTKLLFKYKHHYLLHAGPQLLLSTIRDTYWPIAGRNLARATVKGCNRCFRFNASTIQPIMGNLPTERITPSSPFTVVGVDYAGPFMVKDRKGRGYKVSKVYIGLFICFSTKAIHLELISSLSSESFIQALYRFVSRRGKPTKIFSDNGTNFVGAQHELKIFLNSNIANEQITNFATSECIDWQFIPPCSPHFGGLWEAGVKSSKYHLKRVLSDTPLLFEELSTICAQIEAILNSRPICPISSDPNDLHPLTPAHFLIGKPLVAAPDENVTDFQINRLNRFQLIQQMCQHFWQRWQNEYVAELQQRTRWKQNQSSLSEGSIVLIKQDNSMPTRWQLGRIVTLHPGSDGISRVATIKTSNGIIKRGFQKICPLPTAL